MPSILHLMHAITHAYASTHTTGLMHEKKIAHTISVFVWDIGMKKMKERSETLN